ncbi:hypothetical protein LWC34_38980 [Kibdelosporangium philippinense]|uniref:Uncharacterized protein n=1 Tax=Kibdelosporangium philippinense TaxID=211113 RepID=A0ABS8ZP95_9PSEU|nr:hypothetical protein [Kibdelosporangium philippinense]MCE7008755.1 hypothetical protein [Kibdelosporangium philippinense]
MTLRIETKHLVELLGTLAYTAGTGILLHTARGYPTGGEPGKSDLLVGTSSTGRVAGHTNVVTFGQLSQPMLWSIEDVDAVLASYRPRLKDNKDHSVEIELTGGHIIVREDPDMFGDGLQIEFTAGDTADYPRELWSLLTDEHVTPRVETEQGSVVARSPRTDYTPADIAPFVTIAKALKCELQTFNYHHRLPTLVQIGHKYRGLIRPVLWPDERSPRLGEGPTSEVYPANLPPKNVVNLRSATGVHIGTARAPKGDAADG